MEFKEYFLGELCEIKSSKRIYAKDYVNKGVPFYRSKEIIEKSNGLDISQKLYIDNKKFEEIEEKHGVPETGDLLLTSVGTLGVPYIVKNEKFYFKDGNLTWFTNFKPLLNQYYLFYWFKSKEGIGEINRVTIGSTQKALTIKNLRYLKITLPDKKNQFKITNLIQKIESKLENNKQIIANLEELSQTLFKRWFVDFEFPDENGNPYKSSGGEMVDSELGEIPKSWKVDELGNYIKIKSGKRPKNKVDKKDIENVVPIIGASKIMGYTNDYLYNEKIIIIGRVGTHGVIQRFSTRTWPSDNTFVIISDFESIIYQVLKSIDYISLNRGSTQPLLSQKDIKNTKVVMPTNATLLSKYQKENNHILKMMDQKNKENENLIQLRDTLLPKLMSGEIEIPDDIEVNEDELSI
ncbi:MULTISPECIES: restriction endonuclease subunit S [Staphylococcaceae]|uniref:Restriction endonuclease subunit S n=1 Tax=Macrococcus equipercicus TaxID=69967 RepID=A0A9Q9F1Z2_9STAP|nr:MULTISPECIES: restriction endonuclease subunit S [Macrococcus]MBC9873925.1 restriction endonuclease subunit S [Macrococcus bohemicus]UTH13826.1 restriction endonuclease subunit S [Macrococcus equipercicus]